MVLAEELNATRLLIDDLAARREAKSRRLPVTGTVAVVLLAKKLGDIPTVKYLFDDLIIHGARIGEKLYQDALVVAGE
jgi:predicted nucleic acid-binding protein